PGKTRMLNVFEMPAAGLVGAQHAAPLHHAYYVLDLPGYGYAKASHTDRRAFRLLITHVLDRTRLAGVLWLLDLRREPSAVDSASAATALPVTTVACLSARAGHPVLGSMTWPATSDP